MPLSFLQLVVDLALPSSWSFCLFDELLLCPEVDTTDLVVHGICSMQVMDMHKSSLYCICPGITSFFAQGQDRVLEFNGLDW